jgi:translation initiation factor IF-3
MRDKKNLINENIKHNFINIIKFDGSKIDNIPLSEALELAFEYNLDLVQVGTQADLAVCKIMDFGKYLYDNKKKKKSNAGSSKPIKEIYFRPATDVADKDKKVRDIKSFLSKGHDVKVGVKFKGRELAHKHIGVKLLENIKDEVTQSNIGKIKSSLSYQGKNVSIEFSPQ